MTTTTNHPEVLGGDVPAVGMAQDPVGPLGIDWLSRGLVDGDDSGGQKGNLLLGALPSRVRRVPDLPNETLDIQVDLTISTAILKLCVMSLNHAKRLRRYRGMFIKPC